MTINDFKQYQPRMRTKAAPWKGWKGTTSEKGPEISFRNNVRPTSISKATIKMYKRFISFIKIVK